MNGQKFLKLGCHNVEGLSAKLCESDYVEFMHQHDIFCAQETFTHENFDFSIYFKNYETFHKPAVKLKEKGRRSGGIAVFIKKMLMKYITPITCDADTVLAFHVDKSLLGLDADITMIFIYNHPYKSTYYNLKDYDCSLVWVQELLMSEENYGNYSMVFGDLNSRIGEWNLSRDENIEYTVSNDIPETFGSRKTNDNITNTFGKELINLCEICQLVPLNGNTEGDSEGKHTFVSNQGKSVIDLALVSADIFDMDLCCFHVLPRVESPHSPIYIPIYGKICQQRHKHDKSTTKSISKLKWDPDKAHIFKLEMEKYFDEFERVKELIDISPNDAVQLFTSSIVKAADCMRRTVRIRTGKYVHKNDWYDAECKASKQAAQEAKTQYDIQQDDKVKEKHFLTLRSEYKTITRGKRRQSKRDKLTKLIQNKNDGEKFWSTIKSLRPNVKVSPNIHHEKWKKHFENVFEENKTMENADSKQEKEMDYIYEPALDNDITQEEVKEAVRSLKTGKASGLDEVCGEFLKHSEDITVPLLTRLFNELYDKSYYPVEWCKAVIVPILKNGDDSNPDNYRGISLLSIISKTFTSILNKRLYSWCEEHNKISFEQAAFRKTFSTTDHIFTLRTIIRNRLHSSNGGKVYACFVDFHKAYDKINRQSLWYVFKNIGISNKLLAMFKTMYNSVRSCVRWNGTLSSFFECPSGLRQGCLCSPLAFALLIGKVADYVREKGKHGFQLIPGGPEIFQLLFADDIVLLSSTPQGLQSQIDNLRAASESLGLKVNMAKTKVMVFRKGGFLGKYEKWTFGNQRLETVNKYKYLGYTLTIRLSETIACEDFIIKAKRKVFDILKTMWSLGSLNTDIFFQLFDAQVKPMLLYAAEVWGWKSVDSVETAHMFACKRILSVSDRSPNHMVYGETGRHPILIEAKIAAVRYWLKVMKMSENRLPKQALLSMQIKYERDEHDKRADWYAGVRKCVTENGFISIWENGGTVNEKEFLKNLKESLIRTFQAEWQERIQTSDRFAFYWTFKRQCYQESYLNDITIKKFRDAVIRFRMGLNSLKINKRYNSTFENKLCPFCPTRDEDENHFMFICPEYEDIREKYLSKHFDLEMMTVAEILQVNCVKSIRQVAMYIYYGLERRYEQFGNSQDQ